jgi:hypothetical protein
VSFVRFLPGEQSCEVWHGSELILEWVLRRRFHGYTLRILLRIAVPVFLVQRSLGTQEGSDLRVRSNGKEIIAGGAD